MDLKDKTDVTQGVTMSTETFPDLLDITGLVRSLQRQEGCPDCFRRARGACDRMDCFWRPWCLGNIRDFDGE